MTTPDTPGPERTRLNFAHAVEQSFSFLTSYPFERAEASPTVVRYVRDGIEICVFHGRSSFEVGVEVCGEGSRYSLSEIIRVTDPIAAENYRNPAVTGSTELLRAVEMVAAMVRRYGEPALRGDRHFLAKLKEARRAWSESYAMDVLADQIRPRAELAFKEGRYADAVALYQQVSARLSPTERGKLALAQARQNAVRCPWERINDFRSHIDFDKFEEWLDEQVAGGACEAVPVTEPYLGSNAFCERWVRHLKSDQVWRLVQPDAPFTGLFEPVAREAEQDGKITD